MFLPCWRQGRPAAWDFAVTSGLQIGAVDAAAMDGGCTAMAYCDRKRMYLNTAAHCADEGILFVPMVVEASGGAWCTDARRVWRDIAAAAARLTGERAAVLTERFEQSLSITLHRANARAIIRRANADAPRDRALAAAHSVLAAAEVEQLAAGPPNLA